PDSRHAAFPSWQNPGWDRRAHEFGVQIWDLAECRRRKLFLGHAGQVYAVAFSPCGKLLASGGVGPTVHLWDLATDREVLALQDQGALRVAFRPDGTRLAVATADAVHVWDLSRGERLVTLSGHGPEKLGGVCGMGYSPDGKYLASVGGDGAVRLHDAATHESLGQRHLEIGKLGAMSWLPDSSGLVAGRREAIAASEAAE